MAKLESSGGQGHGITVLTLHQRNVCAWRSSFTLGSERSAAIFPATPAVTHYPRLPRRAVCYPATLVKLSTSAPRLVAASTLRHGYGIRRAVNHDCKTKHYDMPLTTSSKSRWCGCCQKVPRRLCAGRRGLDVLAWYFPEMTTKKERRRKHRSRINRVATLRLFRLRMRVAKTHYANTRLSARNS